MTEPAPPAAGDRSETPVAAQDGSERPVAAQDRSERPVAAEDRSAPSAAEVTDALDVVETVLQTRRAKADRATRAVLAALLGLEALVVMLVPRAIAQTPSGLDGTKTGLLLALTVALVAAAFVLRRPWGIGLGSALQGALLLTGVLESVMFLIAAIFIAIWLWVLTMRRDLVGTPGGARLLVS